MGGKTNTNATAAILLVCIGFFALVKYSPSDTGKHDMPRAIMISDDPRTVLKARFGCRELEELDAIAKLKTQGDDAALHQGISRAIVKDRCRLLNIGDIVYVSDVSVWRGRVKIRPKGEVEQYWTFDDLFERAVQVSANPAPQVTKAPVAETGSQTASDTEPSRCQLAKDAMLERKEAELERTTASGSAFMSSPFAQEPAFLCNGSPLAIAHWRRPVAIKDFATFAGKMGSALTGAPAPTIARIVQLCITAAQKKKGDTEMKASRATVQCDQDSVSIFLKKRGL